jgi:hypothetical protein
LSLFVINLDIAFGAGLYESRIIVPQWLSFSPEYGYRWDAEAARQANVGLLGVRDNRAANAAYLSQSCGCMVDSE